MSMDNTDLLLTEVVTDLNLGTLVLDVNVNGEMGVDVTHLVPEALGNTSDHILQNGLNGTHNGNVLTAAVEHLDLDLIGRDLVESDINVLEVLLQGTTGSSDTDNTSFNLEVNTLRDVQDLLALDVLH